MTDVILLALVGFAGGVVGSMVGLGGGVFIIPGLTLFLGVPMHSAISAGLLAVVATSITATAAFIRSGLTNVGLGVSLECLAVFGALGGGLLGTFMGGQALSAVFGGVTIVVSVYMATHLRAVALPDDIDCGPGRFGARYHDCNLRREVGYRPRRVTAGAASSFAAGWISGLLGVGGGFLKVPVMTLVMRVPARAAVATGSFMTGITASVGGVVYLARDLVDPAVAVPVVLGVMAGAYLGSKVAVKIRSSILVGLLAVVLFVLSVQMILVAFGISVR